MYFQECEHLASKYLDMKEIIERIDEFLKTCGPSYVLRTEIVAEKLNLNSVHVTNIFQLLAEKELLKSEQRIEHDCGELVALKDYLKAKEDQDPLECPKCGENIIARCLNEVTIYRLAARSLKKKEDPHHPLRSSLPLNFRQNLPASLLNDPFQDSHLLRYYSSQVGDLGKEKPFKGKRMLFILHFLRDLVPFVIACEKLGMETENAAFFYKDYPYPQKEALKEWLLGRKATVLNRFQHETYLNQLVRTSTESIGEILIVEDGGFLVPSIYRKFTNLISYVVGAVEQTTRGVWNDQECAKEGHDLQFPILSVATCKLKGDFEPPYIAEAALRNIERMLPDISLRGQSVAVLGYGTIGNKVANSLRGRGMNVIVFDTNSDNILKARQEGFQVHNSAAEAVQNKNLVVGASGNRSIDSSVIANLDHGTIILSTSSELYEIDMEELEKQKQSSKEYINDEQCIGTLFKLPPNGKEIVVLANGYPINFWGLDSMPNQASDLILSLLLLCAAEVALKRHQKGINETAVNEISKKYELSKKFTEFHQSK